MNILDLYKATTYQEKYHFGNESYPAEPFWHAIKPEDIIKNWDDRIKNNPQNHKFGLHINIPFCETKCSYCTHSVTVGNNLEIERYIQALENEMREFSPHFKDTHFSSLYIGGGTPSILTEGQLCDLYINIRKYFNVADIDFNMLEFSPSTATEEKIIVAKENGVCRVTFGIQDINQEVLLKNGRPQVVDQIKSLVKHLKKHDISFINADVMAGLPFQTVEYFKKTLDFAMSLDISSICLNIFKPTDKTSAQNKGLFDSEYYAKRKEMVDYWRKEYSHKTENVVEEESREDLYPFDRSNTSFLGLGFGANSRIYSKMCYKKGKLSNYMDGIDNFYGYTISVEEEIVKYILLRLKETGISFSEIKFIFGIQQIPNKIVSGMDFLRRKGLIFSFEKEGDEFFRFNSSSDILYSLYSKIFYANEILKTTSYDLLKNPEKYKDMDNKIKQFFIG